MGYYVTMPDGSQEWVDAGMTIGDTTQYKEDVNSSKLDDFILGSYNQEGLSTSFNFDTEFLDDFTNEISPINQSQLNTATNLFEATKQSSQMISSSINELSNAMNNISNVLNRGNLSTDNLGVNIKSIIGSLVSQTAVGNKINHLNSKLQNFHNEYQTAKNTKQMEQMEFEKNGDANLKNSNDEVIKPREAKAIKESEEGIEAKRANTTDLRPMLDELANFQNDEESDFDLVSYALNKMVEEIDATKIDNQGVNNG